MNAKKVLLVAAYFVTVLMAVVTARDYYSTDKRAQDRPFMMSSRYGRAGGGSNTANGGKHVVVAPRTDKFFLASRYGKRSSVLSGASMGYSANSLPLCGTDENLSCAYTGFSNLYRCDQKKFNINDEISSVN